MRNRCAPAIYDGPTPDRDALRIQRAAIFSILSRTASARRHPVPVARKPSLGGTTPESDPVAVSIVVVVPAREGDWVVVLHSGGAEVRRQRLHFPAGGLHELQP